MMSKSSSIRSGDFAATVRLVGECRDMGDDHDAWRRHFLDGLTRLVDAEHGCIGEMAGCDSLDLKDLGAVFWWKDGCTPPPSLDPEGEAFIREPKNWPVQAEYHRLTRSDRGTCLARSDFIDAPAWLATPEYRWGRDLLGMDHRLWCFRPIPGIVADEHIGLILYRAEGHRDYAPRDRAVVGLAQELMAPLVGGPLARFSEPSPMDLAPQVRRVLRLLLEGEGDKQIAAKMGLSVHTVNQYTKAIYRHFRTPGRSRLMARWIRRGWGLGASWAD